MGSAADEAPQIVREVDPLRLQRQIGASVFDDRLHLEAVADDAFVLHQPLHILLVEADDEGGIEVGIGAVIAVGALENGDPGEPRLLAIEAELGKQLPRVAYRPPPLSVMVFEYIPGPWSPRRSAVPFLVSCYFSLFRLSVRLSVRQGDFIGHMRGLPSRANQAQRSPAP